MKRVHLLIYGNVQGVGFRYYIQNKARISNLVGWVKNNHDGSVEVIAEGGGINIKRFIEYCKTGPSGASVKELKVYEELVQHEDKDFSVRF